MHKYETFPALAEQQPMLCRLQNLNQSFATSSASPYTQDSQPWWVRGLTRRMTARAWLLLRCSSAAQRSELGRKTPHSLSGLQPDFTCAAHASPLWWRERT